ncbi:MAG TPA: type II secretion system protein [Gemmatimonadales bacterium]|nr:type II secretion system protein [Gemmatimonadales bacterium]
MGRPQVHGFTMIELMIVIILLGVLTAVSFPTVSRVTTHSRVNQAAMVVAQGLMTTVSNASRERKPMRIARGADLRSITVTDRVSGTLLSTRKLGAGGDAYVLDSVSFSVTPVDVFPSGFTSSALTVTLWANGYSRKVTMSRAGWVRVP